MKIQDLDPEKLQGYLQRDNGPAAPANRRLFEVVVKVEFKSQLPKGEWNRALVNDFIKRRVEQVLKAVLEDEHPEWDIQLEVLGKFRGPDYDTDARFLHGR